jgi:hypothetical protein
LDESDSRWLPKFQEYLRVAPGRGHPSIAAEFHESGLCLESFGELRAELLKHLSQQVSLAYDRLRSVQLASEALGQRQQKLHHELGIELELEISMTTSSSSVVTTAQEGVGGELMEVTPQFYYRYKLN